MPSHVAALLGTMTNPYHRTGCSVDAERGSVLARVLRGEKKTILYRRKDEVYHAKSVAD